jgi:predicted dehydrogenase
MARDRLTHNSSARSRRDFLKSASSLAAAGALSGGLSIARGAHAEGSDLLRVGLIGCGGRGTGAAVNALGADENCRLVAMADVFADRLEISLDALRKRAAQMESPHKVAVDKEHCFVGFDAADKLIQSGVDVVLLATPPHFRPMHLKAAVAAGKHVFCEKPVAVDAPGVRSVLAIAEEAKKKNLSLVSGLCWRYDPGVCETMKRVLDGAIGELKSIQETYLTNSGWRRGRKPQHTEMEYQLLNWPYFTWLSGDFNVEQHVHSLDKAAWAMHEEPPVQAWGLGGRQLRKPEDGDIYDHHAVTYECAGGVHVHSYCRQIAGCYNDVSDVFVGTKGRAILPSKPRIEGENPWHYSGPTAGSRMYDEEHRRLFAAIRSGQPINNGLYMARSTMWGILGRMVDWTGQKLTWEEAINSQHSMGPARYALDADPPTMPNKDGRYPIAMPGLTKFM